jgi:type II secretory pathway pseudopilin PulG
MIANDKKGFSLVEILITLGLVLALVAVGLALLNNERAQVRDAHRLADMTRIAAAFDVLHNETNSYLTAALGCNEVGQLVSQCKLSTYLEDITQVLDPGSSDYLVTSVPNDQSYEITFSLERGYNSLSAGQHTLSELGIR